MSSPQDEAPTPQPLPAPLGNESALGPQRHIDVCVGDAARQARPVLEAVLLPPRRRLGRPIFLFLVTCFTTFCAGCYQWSPAWIGEAVFRPSHGKLTMSELIALNWRDGLLFMICVMSALMFHEMGHFLMTIKHRVHASFPHFIPFPMMITGTMGAVIGMDGPRMNRKSLFDIGIAGPLAGLVLIIPFVIVGILVAEPQVASSFGNPLLVELLIPVLRPDLPAEQTLAANPFFMAGWVGMLVTGLNMIPISQLDGGHVCYSVFGQHAKWVPRGVIFLAIGWMLWADSYNWTLMLTLILIMGVDHPPTSNDSIDIGWGRRILGIASLSIPILCFTPIPLSF